VPARVRSRDTGALAALSSPISKTLPIPVESHAFHYWIANFTGWPDSLLDLGHEYGAHALNHWKNVQPGSSLYMALSAFSLAVFGLARHSNEALEKADKLHTQGITNTRKEIEITSNRAIDQLLVATTLMASYDVCLSWLYKDITLTTRQALVSHAKDRFVQLWPHSGTKEVGSRHWKNISHLNGAAALLQMRQQQGGKHNLPLERGIRRAIVSELPIHYPKIF
jgi:hypothetical protein